MSAVREVSQGDRKDGAAAARGEDPSSVLARYEAVLNSTLDPIVTVDDRGTIQGVSRSIERVFGWRPEELVGRNISMLMPSPHREQHDGYMAEYRATGVTNILGRTREMEAVRRDGTLVPIEISVSRVDVPGQDEPLFTGIIHDISDRKRSELELRLLQSLALEIAQAGDLVTAMATALERICSLTGWDYGEAWLPDGTGRVLVGAPVWHARSPEFDQFQVESKDLRFAPGEGLPGRVWAERRPVWMESLHCACSRLESARRAGFRAGLGVPILSDDDVVAVLVFLMREARPQDARLVDLVTAAVAALGPALLRKRIENALAESEHRFRTILEGIELVAVTLDRDGQITFCNDHLLQLTGYHRDEVMGTDWFGRFLPSDERALVRQVFTDSLVQERIPPRMESAIVTREGERRAIAWHNTVMRDDHGRVAGVTGLGVDITERRRAEQELTQYRKHLEELVAERTAELESSHEALRQADRLVSIGTLAAGLGHDMNNVLLPVRCRLDALDAQQLPEGTREHVAAVRASVEYLQHLADGLHLLALDPDDVEASRETTDLGVWWPQVGPLLTKGLPKQVRFATSWPSDLPRLLVAPHRLTQAVLNLIVNAGEAVTAREGRVRLWAQPSDDGATVRIGVSDNGCGMSDEVRRQALDPFFTTKKRGLGTGLGLSLVRGVVRSVGGSIDIESTLGEGTDVILTLPATGVATTQHDHRRAVICVDDPRIAGLVGTIVESTGMQVESVNPPELPSCGLLVADPRDDMLAAVRKHFGRFAPPIVLLGEASDGWTAYRPTVISDVSDFRGIREAIARAIQERT
jgi:PAS domain S-box-containing protein